MVASIPASQRLIVRAWLIIVCCQADALAGAARQAAIDEAAVRRFLSELQQSVAAITARRFSA